MPISTTIDDTVNARIGLSIKIAVYAGAEHIASVTVRDKSASDLPVRW